MDGLFERSLQMDYPYIIGYMSVDVQRDYYHDLSQLKYLTSIPKGKIHYNLNHNIDKAVKRTTDDNNEKISLMLKFLLDQRSRLEFLSNKPEMTFITYRRSLISVMCASYNREPLSIVASLFNNCIYLCSIENLQVKKSIPPNHRNAKFCAWGYKFEQYMLSDSPIQQPNIEQPVVENEEFSIYYSSQLGKHKLFYGAQIDGMLATRTTSGPPDPNNLNANLSYLRNNKFVELKTNREIHSRQQEQNFKYCNDAKIWPHQFYEPNIIFRRYKMLRCWCQCYLAGLKGLLVGYRNDNGIIQRVQCFDTDDIVRYCRFREFVTRESAPLSAQTIYLVKYYEWEHNLSQTRDEWKPQIAINYLDHFLTYVENCFKSLKETSDDDFVYKEPITLKFDIDAHQKITVSKDIQEEHVILPEWYVGSTDVRPIVPK